MKVEPCVNVVLLGFKRRGRYNVPRELNSVLSERMRSSMQTMKRFLLAPVLFAALTAFATAQPPGPGGRGPGGPGGPDGKGPGGPPPIGQVLPDFVQEKLNLSDEQKSQVA